MLSTCVFVLFGDALTAPFIQQEVNVRDYSFTVDQLGNVFFVRKDEQGQSLIGLDSTGAEMLRTEISLFFDPHFFVDNIFVLQNKNIWITGYNIEPETLFIQGVKIIALREDGSYIEDIYRADLTVFKDNLFRMVSSIDEDDRYVYFAAFDAKAGIINSYSFANDGSEPLRKIGENSLPSHRNVNLIAFHALPGGGIVLSFSDGSLLLYSAMGESRLNVGELYGACIDRFWSGAGVYYLRDAVSGTVYSSPHGELRPISVINGSFLVSAEGGMRFRDMHEISVSGVGNVLGVRHTRTESELYLGGFTFLPDITAVSRIRAATIEDWLIVIAVVSGIIISSILVWEFFVHFMRMRMSMIIRQALLVAFVIFIAFFILSRYILIPDVTDALNQSHRSNLGSSTDVLLSMMKTTMPANSSADDYALFLENFSAEYNAHERGNSPVYAYLITRGNYDFMIAASSAGHPPGIAMNTALPYTELSSELYAGVAIEGQYIQLITELGKKLAVLKYTGVTVDGAETYLCVIENMSQFDSKIDDFVTLVNTFLFATGLGLALLLILTVIFHVITLKRLNGILHAFAIGKYVIKTEIHTADETGEMFRHIKKLSVLLQEKETSLNTLSGSYHRFVPERFLKLLGETRVEKVDKGMQTRIEGAYVVVIRFDVSGGSEKNIFLNANLVLENIVPIIVRHGGTVYNFLHNGFDGVFEKSALDALSSALSIRDVCRKLDKRLTAEMGIRVDLRVVLIKGDITLGFIGDQTRMESTAISDAYPVAESLMHTCFGSSVFIAAVGEFYDEIKSKDYRMRRIGKTPVGGSVIDFYDIYESDPLALHELKKSFADRFELGVSLFEKGDYHNAIRMFVDIIKYSTLDDAARNYLYLSELNLRNVDKRPYYTVVENESAQLNFAAHPESHNGKSYNGNSYNGNSNNGNSYNGSST
jgi:hypothetical protein